MSGLNGVNPSAKIEIPCQRGDLALMLMGYKTLQCVPHATPFKPGDCLWFSVPYSIDQAIPMIVTAAEPMAPDDCLSIDEYKKAGRFVPYAAQTHVAIHASDLLAEGTPTSKPLQKISVRFCNEADAQRLYGARTDAYHAVLPVWRKAYFKAATKLLEPLKQSHHYVHSTAKKERREHNLDQSLIDALQYLKDTQDETLNGFIKQLKAPANQLSQESRLYNQTTRRHAHDQLADGIGLGRAMAVFPMADVSLSNGILAAMEVLPRLIVRHEIKCNKHEHDRGVVRLQMRHQTSSVDQLSFEFPVIIDPREKPTTFHARDFTDSMARQHGYASVRDMRLGLRLKPNDNPLFYSYGITPAHRRDLLEDEDKAGKRLVDRRDAAYAVWTSDDCANEYKGRSKDSPKQLVDRFLQTLPAAAAVYAQALITPPAERTPEQLEAIPMQINRAGTREVPREVAAVRDTIPAPRVRGMHARMVRAFTGKRNVGDGWTFQPAPKQRREQEEEPEIELPNRHRFSEAPPPRRREANEGILARHEGRRHYLHRDPYHLRRVDRDAVRAVDDYDHNMTPEELARLDALALALAPSFGPPKPPGFVEREEEKQENTANAKGNKVR